MKSRPKLREGIEKNREESYRRQSVKRLGQSVTAWLLEKAKQDREGCEYTDVITLLAKEDRPMEGCEYPDSRLDVTSGLPLVLSLAILSAPLFGCSLDRYLTYVGTFTLDECSLQRFFVQ